VFRIRVLATLECDVCGKLADQFDGYWLPEGWRVQSVSYGGIQEADVLDIVAEWGTPDEEGLAFVCVCPDCDPAELMGEDYDPDWWEQEHK